MSDQSSCSMHVTDQSSKSDLTSSAVLVMLELTDEVATGKRMHVITVAHNCHGKTKIHGTTNFTHGKTMLSDGKTKLIHGRTPLIHGNTKFSRGKTKFTHGKTNKTSWSAVGQRQLK